jgi:IS5 family transposase
MGVAWYALSDEALEKQIARDLMFRRFIDSSLSEAAPDHSSIWRFRQLLFMGVLDGCYFIRLVVFWLSYAKVSL